MNEKEIPAIRFQGFTDDWEQRKLGDLAEVNPKSVIPEKFEYVDLESVVGTEIIAHRTETRDSAPSRAQRLAKKGDVFYQTVRPYQKNNCLFEGAERSYVFSTGYAQFRSHGDSYFLLTMLQREDFVNNVLDRCTGTSYPAINANVLADLTVSYPVDIQEQIKIGQYFKRLDYLIALHQRKLTKLQLLKKSMLTKMFPKDGARVPEIRFQGFHGDWEQRKVSDICSISTGKSNTQDKEDDGIYPFYVRSPIIEHSNKYLYDEEAVLTVGDGVGTGKVFHYVNGKYDLHQRVYRMYGFSDNISAKFFYQYFSKEFYNRVMAMTAKTSVDSVRYKMIADMDIQLPSKAEQDKIAKFLFSLDGLISLHQRKLSKLQQIKQAMLSKLFV